ncbi:hypothetical protein BS78_K337900 [Paspalum vaginatum]|uniref:Uncharacterized protein n=1 Tax=Paspalum vaginatum TaxID=158149 RepID=A0A9W8CGA1_9POAL|nr:hypothetical protein BS78_K337900 [Paspalum vaginatum]
MAIYVGCLRQRWSKAEVSSLGLATSATARPRRVRMVAQLPTVVTAGHAAMVMVGVPADAHPTLAGHGEVVASAQQWVMHTKRSTKCVVGEISLFFSFSVKLELFCFFCIPFGFEPHGWRRWLACRS